MLRDFEYVLAKYSTDNALFMGIAPHGEEHSPRNLQ
jgi:hypothetical protein